MPRWRDEAKLLWTMGYELANVHLTTMTILEDILSEEECERLIDLYECHCDRAPMRDYGHRPLLDYYTIRERDTESADWLYGVSLRCKEKIEVDLHIAQLLVESFYITCLVPGDSHPPHADNERQEGDGWVPNHTPQRDYTAIAYLNNGFTGGDLVFPDRDLVITPRPGLLVGFPCNHEFVHGVPPVVSGKRYSLPIWFTFDRTKAIQL